MTNDDNNVNDDEDDDVMLELDKKGNSVGTTFLSELSLLFQSFIVQALYNIESGRIRNPSLSSDKRGGEGWTEEWGKKEKTTIQNKYNKFITIIDDEYNDNEEMKSYPQLLFSDSDKNKVVVMLYQYDVAWFEQLVLRILQIPHMVMNSSYIATEATGPLPYLIHTTSTNSNNDNDNDNTSSSSSSSLIGRCHPKTTTTRTEHNNNKSSNNKSSNILQNNNNDILHFLQTQYKDNVLFSSDSNPEEYWIQSLIVDRLIPSEQKLRLEDDNWSKLYRRRYYSSENNNNSVLYSHFNSWCHRIMCLRSSSSATTNKTSAQQHLDVIEDCYASLEKHLTKTKKYLFYDDRVTLTDAYLWSHLSHALSNVDLINDVLHKYPNLLQFYQTIHDRYFVPSDEEKEQWKLWNTEQNNTNVFGYYYNNITLLHNNTSDNTTNNSNTSIVWRFLLQQKETMDVSNLVTNVSNESKQLTTVKPTTRRKNTLYIWRMGGFDDSIEKAMSSKKKGKDEDKERQKKYRNEYKSNDEKWFTTVIGLSALAVVVSAIQRRKQ